MKSIIFSLLVALTLWSCKDKPSNQESVVDGTAEIAYASFGDEISDADALSAAQMAEV